MCMAALGDRYADGKRTYVRIIPLNPSKIKGLIYALNIFLKYSCVIVNSTCLCLVLHSYNCHGRLSAKTGGNHEQRYQR